MKILLQSTLFFPSVGGIETVSQCLAEHYVQLGHDCTVITRSEASSPDSFPFRITRNPSHAQKKQLILANDLIHCNGASLELVFWAWWYKKPVVWTHAGYQLISIDGLGWHQGEASPLSPFPSFLFHVKRQGVKRGLLEFAKLLIRRFAARFVHHVSITKWVANRQPFPNQVIVYNPFPIHRFAQLAQHPASEEFDFFFLGRLVSEKGVATLLKAFAVFLKSNPAYTKNLLIIGDGNWRGKLEALASELGVRRQIDFVGKQTGEELLKWVSKGKFAIIPSEWEEPMGGVALEMLAAGKPVIVSERGGLAECVGDAGLLFPNGDHEALAKQMSRLYQEEGLAAQLKKNAATQIKKFNEEELTQQYISLFQSLLSKS